MNGFLLGFSGKEPESEFVLLLVDPRDRHIDDRLRVWTRKSGWVCRPPYYRTWSFEGVEGRVCR